jgi:hypothetical protein
MSSKSTMQEIKHLESLASIPNQPKVSAGFDKNATLANYQDSCIAKLSPSSKVRPPNQ